MPYTLVTEEFSAAKLPEVQEFYCGETPWAKAAAEWIKGGPNARSALWSMRRFGTKVWLYYHKDTDELIGFGSLGKNSWECPPQGERKEVSYIPQIGLRLEFQGQPPGPTSERYSHQMMMHLIGIAYREHDTEFLALHVHSDNAAAIALYEHFDFRQFRDPDEKGNIRMFRILR